MGKILVAKVLGISQIVYQMIHVHTPKAALTQVDTKIYNFLWESPKKVKFWRTVLIQDYEEQGLKALDVFTLAKTMKLKWIEELQGDSDRVWKQIILAELESMGRVDYLVACNYDAKTLSVELTPFWQEVFQAYQELKIPGTETRDSIREHIINNNKNIFNLKNLFTGMIFYTWIWIQ